MLPSTTLQTILKYVIIPICLTVAGGVGGYGELQAQRYTPAKTAADVEVIARAVSQTTKDPRDGKTDVSARLGGIGSASAAHTVEFTIMTDPKDDPDGSKAQSARYLAVYNDKDELLTTVPMP